MFADVTFSEVLNDKQRELRLVISNSVTELKYSEGKKRYQFRDSLVRNIKIPRLFICIEARYQRTSQNL